MLTVVVGDPHAGMCRVIADLVDRQSDMAVVARTGDGRTMARLLERLRPDVLLLDPAALDGDRLAGLPVLQQASPGTKIVLMAMDDRAVWASQLTHGRAAGYISKRSPANTWRPAIIAAARTRLRQVA